MSDDRPGERFTQIYSVRGEPTDDSVRMRRRFAAIISHVDTLDRRLRGTLARRLGIDAPFNKTWSTLLAEMQLRDVLDLVTVAHDLLRNGPAGAGMSRTWLLEIQQVFSEENVHCKVLPEGGVRFAFDENFAQVRAAAIAALTAPRYANSLTEFEKGMVAFAAAQPDGKSALRSTFTAIEGLFALIFPEVRRLASGEVSRLRPLIEQVYSGDRRAQETSIAMLGSLRAWIDAAHGYRHEEGKPDAVAQPPLTLAIYLVSAGASHLRWIAELDAKVLALTAAATE